MARHRPRALKVVVSREKVYEGLLHLRRKEVRASEVRKAIKRDPTWS
jgi:hypothetical protein